MNAKKKPEPVEPAADPFVEPAVMTDDPPKEPGVSEAAANARRVLAEDRARDTPLLDTATAAALQKQADWENDSKEFFRDEDFDRKRRDQLLHDLDVMDHANNAEKRKLAAEAKARADKEEADKLEAEAAAKRKEADELEHQAAALRS